MKPYYSTNHNRLDPQKHQGEDDGSAVAKSKSSPIESSNKRAKTNKPVIFSLIKRVLVLKSNLLIVHHFILSKAIDSKDSGKI